MIQSIKSKKFKKSLLNSIVCPKTKEPLILDEKNKELVSKKGKLAYPIVDGIPILIIEKARKL